MDLSSLSDDELLKLYNNSGRPAKNPEGTNLSKMSDAQLLAMYNRISPPKQEEVAQEPKSEEKGAWGRFGHEMGRQTESLISSARTGYETLTNEDKEAVAKRSEERQQEIAKKYGPERGLAEVEKAYKEKGILSAAGEVAYQVPGALGSLVPTMAGGVVGGLLGGPAGAAIGMGGTSFLTQYGSNLERQFEAQADKGQAINPDQGAAAIGALAQAGLDTVGFMVPFGKAVIAPFSKVASKGGTAAAEKLAAESISKSLMKGTAVGMLAEVPTEVAQQMIERYQAGLDLFSEDAYKEYGDIAYKTAISVAPLGGPGRLIERGAAKSDIAREKAKEEEKSGLAEEQKQYLTGRATEAEQANAARIAQEKAEAEEAAKAAGMGYQPKLEAPTERAEGPAPAPEERTYPELRGDNFVLVGEKSGNPVQGGFRTMEEAQTASDAFNQNIKEKEEAAAIEEKKVKDAKFVELANNIRNAGGTPIYLDDVSTGIAAKIHNARLARAGQPYILDQSAPFTTSQEINALELNEDRNLTVVKRNKDGRILLRSGGPKPDEMNLSDRLLQVQNPGIDVANGLTIPDEQKAAEQAREKEQGKPVVMQGQRDNLAQSARDQQIAEEKAAKDWENNPVRPFSEDVQKQQDRVNKLKEAVDNTDNKSAKDALQKRLAKAQAQLEKAQEKLNEASQKYGVTEGPYRSAEVIGQQKADQQSKIKSAIKAAFDKIGLTKQGIKPEVVSYIADASGKPTKGAEAVAGEFDPATKTITLASDIYDPSLSVEELTSKMMEIVNHEVVHALKQAGLFSPKEWRILENYVKNGQGMKFLERAKLQYPDLDINGQIEEAIAEAAREFDAGSFKPVGAPRSMLKRIVDFFKGLFGAAKAANTTPDQIFNAIRTGEIGERSGTPQAGGKMQAKVGEAGTRNWTNQRGMIQTLGQGMYKENIGNVTAKELIQNAFDGIKSAQAAGILMGPGKITYDFNENERSITITDNGIGMDDDTIKNAFFTVFGTKKKSLSPKDSSGGFGLAKLAYLIASEDIKLETTKDGVTYSVQTNGDEILNFYDTNSDIEVEKKNTPNKSNGTKVYIKLPESVVDTNGEEHKTKVDWPSILADSRRKIIGNVEIYRKSGHSGKMIKVDGITDLSDFRPPQTHKFSWGEVDLYIGNKMVDTRYGSRPVVLSSGIYQFDRDIHDKHYRSPKVESIYNVKSYSTPSGITMNDAAPGRKIIASGYPFNRNRESFVEFVKSDIENLDKIVWAESKAYEIAKDVRAMSSFYKMSPSGGQPSSGFKFRSISAPKTESGVNFEKIEVGVSDVDLENKNFRGDKSKFPSDSIYFHTNLNKDLIEEASKNPKFNKAKAREFFYNLGKIYHDFAFDKLSAVADLDPKYDTYRVENNARIVGVSLDKDYHGVNTVVPITGMFINPFPVHVKLEGKVDSAGIAAEWGRIMLHEAAHEVAKNHSSSFASEEIMLYSLIRQTERNNKNIPTLMDIEDRLEQLYNDYKTEYEAMKNVYDSFDTKNFSESIGGNNEGVTELEERDRERRRKSSGSNDFGSGRQAVPPIGQEGREAGRVNPEEGQASGKNVSESGQVPRENGRPDVKQSRVGYAGFTPSVTMNLNTEAQKNKSEEITSRISGNNQFLSKLAKDEGVRNSQTYKDYIKEFINPYHMLGKGADKYRIAKALASGDIAEVSGKVNDYVEPISKATADKKNIYNYLTTRDASPNMIGNLPARKAAVEIKNLINKIGDTLVSKGLLDEKERDRFRDEYLPRVYLAYIDGKKHVLGGMKTSYQYYLNSRQNLTKEERTRLGEIDDPAFLVQEALFAPMRDIAVLNFFDKINEVGGGQWVIGMDKFEYTNAEGHKYKRSLPELKSFLSRFERMLDTGQISKDRESTAKDEIANLRSFINKIESKLDANVDRGRYLKVPSDTDRFGILAGLWLARPIYRDIMGTGSFVPNNMSGFAALWADGGAVSKATSAFKIAKVAANPPTVFTNIISNTLMMHMADVPMHLILPRISSVFKEIVMDKKGKYYDIAHEFGLKETTLSEAELRKLYKELRDRQTGGSDMNKIANLFYGLSHAVKDVGDKASNMYGMIETVFKAAIIKDGMERQGLSKEEAVLKANKYLFDYSEVHDSIKVLRNVPFGAPFLTWSYKMTPLLIETALKKPWKFLPYVAMYAGVSALASAAMTDAGGDPEDKEKLKKYLSKKASENPFLLVTSPTDAYDFGKFMPFNNMYKFGAELYKGDIVEALRAFGFFGGPIADLGVFALTQKDPFTKMDVFPKGASYEDKAILSFNQIINTFLPPFMKDVPKYAAGHITDSPETIGQSESILVNALKTMFDEPTGKKAGMPVKDASDIIANFFGVNIYHPSAQQLARNMASFNREVSDIKTGMRSAMSDASLTESERKKIVQKYTGLLMDKQKEFREYFKDANVSPEVLKVITESVTGRNRSQ